MEMSDFGGVASSIQLLGGEGRSMLQEEHMMVREKDKRIRNQMLLGGVSVELEQRPARSQRRDNKKQSEPVTEPSSVDALHNFETFREEEEYRKKQKRSKNKKRVINETERFDLLQQNAESPITTTTRRTTNSLIMVSDNQRRSGSNDYEQGYATVPSPSPLHANRLELPFATRDTGIPIAPMNTKKFDPKKSETTATTMASLESFANSYDGDESEPTMINNNNDDNNHNSVNLAIEPKHLSVWKRMPNTAFGVGMGLAGQAIMWKSAGKPFMDEIDTESVSIFFWTSSIVVSCIVFTCYIYKALFMFPLVEDELKHGVRVHFFNMPHVIVLMLTLSVPNSLIAEEDMDLTVKRVIWTIVFIVQILITYNIYERWLFSEDSNISCARPQFLLSTVGWFLLANLGALTRVEETWGIALPSFCFGVGMIFYLMVSNAIFNGIHVTPKAKGSPALFLLIAPPSVGVVAYDNLTGGDDGVVDVMAEVLFGWCLGVLLLLIKLGPKIMQHPPSFGAYWAYVFPMSALATASVRIAWEVGSRSTHGMAIVLIVAATSATLIVFIRELFHSIQVARGRAEWNDPLLSKERLAAATQIYTYTEVVETVEAA